jgi:hypothetical protein
VIPQCIGGGLDLGIGHHKKRARTRRRDKEEARLETGAPAGEGTGKQEEAALMARRQNRA